MKWSFVLLCVAGALLSVFLGSCFEALPACIEGKCQACTIGGKQGTRCCDDGLFSPCTPTDEKDPVICAGTVCTGDKICQSRRCVCPAGFTDCAGTCRNLISDSRNCGQCNKICPVGTHCQPTMVLALARSTSDQTPQPAFCACIAPTVSCGGVCRNTNDDPSNCGTCGHVCTAPTGACRKSKCVAPEGPSNSPTAGSTGNLPLDLFWTTTDPNGLPFNPDWRARSNPDMVDMGVDGIPRVSPAKACPACFPDQKCVDACKGDSSCRIRCFPNRSCWQRCTTYPLAFDTSLVLGHFCGHGHVNWMPATYSGALRFGDYSARGVWSSLTDDDDYSFNLITKDGVGQVGRRNELHSEMSFLETLDRVREGFWSKLVDRVDDAADDLAGPRELFGGIRGRDAIVIGLLNLDTAHSAKVELHPIYAMAVRTGVNNPIHDCWAIFVRNWGNEGWCSRLPHALGLSHITFRLPQPGATAVTELSRHYKATSKLVAFSEVGFVPDGAEVTFTLGQPGAETQINGEICLRWAVAPDTKPLPLAVAATDAATADVEGDHHPGIDLLSDAQRAKLNASLPARKRNRNRAIFEPKRVPAPAKLARPRDGKVVVHDRVGPPDLQKEAIQLQIHRKVCDMLHDHPKRPAICDGP